MTRHRNPLDFLLAFALLVVFKVTMRIGGFKSVHRLVRSWPTIGRRRSDTDSARGHLEAIDRAAKYVLSKSWCLQRSGAAVMLLRLHGFPARLVIAVRKVPFYAHAWAEIGGEVLGDHPSVQQKYTVIETC